MTYLTTAYAPYFAVTQLEDGEHGVVIEVATDRLDVDLLYPDEDFIAQALAHQMRLPIEALHKRVRRTIRSYQHHTCDSIAALGNAAYRGTVSPSAITRYAKIDTEKQKYLCWMGLDPSISLLNYKFMGSKYRSIIAWIMGDRQDFDADGFGNQSITAQINPKYVEHLRELWANRDGIEVVTL